MTDFVKQAKVKRQILDLEKKIKKDKSTSNEEYEDTAINEGSDSTLNKILTNIPFINQKSLKYKMYMNIIIYVIIIIILDFAFHKFNLFKKQNDSHRRRYRRKRTILLFQKQRNKQHRNFILLDNYLKHSDHRKINQNTILIIYLIIT